MSDLSRSRIELIFHQVRELPEEEREASLNRLCKGDNTLRDQVAQLLNAHKGSEGFLEMSALSSIGVAPESSDPDIGRVVASYKLEKLLGSGGMGRVYYAERTDGDYTLNAAIKLVHRGFLDKETRRRFRNECRILATLQHSNVARMSDGGVEEDGTSFLVMEYVDGCAIDLWAMETKPSVRELLRIFKSICLAVHYVNQHGIVHRDLKPGNVLVNREGRPKIVDFGIARALEASDQNRNYEVTSTGMQAMTPAYASPEQLRGEPATTAVDVYALGVLLYRLLTGHLPHDPGTLSLSQFERAVSETTPALPSQKILDEVATRSGPAISAGARRRLSRRVCGDLDRIVLMALRKEPDRRYRSAAEFADDIERYMSGYPVIARPDTFQYRFGKFVRRNPAASLATGSLALVLLTASVAGFWLYGRADNARIAAEQSRVLAEESAATAERSTEFLADLFAEAAPDKTLGEARTAREILDLGALKLSEGEDDPLIRSRLMTTIGDIYTSLGAFDDAESLFKEALAIRLGELDPEALPVAESYRAIGNLQFERGDFASARDNFEEAIRIRELQLGPDHLSMALLYNNLGNVLEEIEEREEAEKMLRHALSIIEEAKGPDDPEAGKYLNNLAILVNGMGRTEESLPLYERALGIYEVAYGEDHPLTSGTLMNFAIATYESGNTESAAPLFGDLVERQERILGAEHPNLAIYLLNYGVIVSESGQWEKALAIFVRAQRIVEATGGTEHPRLVSNLWNQASTLLELGRADEAARIATRALAIAELHFDPDHARVTACKELLDQIAEARAKERDNG